MIWTCMRSWFSTTPCKGRRGTQNLPGVAPRVGSTPSLRYESDAKTDQYGNQFRFRAKMNPDRADEVGRWAYDVFFVSLCAEK